jgi:hypothetical protein
VTVPAGGGEHRSGGCLPGLTIAEDLEAAGQDVDGFVELVVRMRDRATEPCRDGDLHRGETCWLIVVAGQDVHRLPCIAEAGAFARPGEQRHGHVPTTRPVAEALPADYERNLIGACQPGVSRPGLQPG